MDNQSINKNVTAQSEFIDLREILKKYLKNWYWFLISICVCCIVAFVFVKKSPVQYKIQTTILLRTNAAMSGTKFSEQAILQAMGLPSASKEIEDEIQVIQSRTLIREVIKTLDIQTSYFKRGRWHAKELYPNSPIRLTPPTPTFNDTLSVPVRFKINFSKKGYDVKIKHGDSSYRFLLKNISSPIETNLGVFYIESNAPLEENTIYEVITYPTEMLVETYLTSINVAPINKNSNAIALSHVSACIPKSKDILNKLVEVYNMDAISDKNLITTNAKLFVDERVDLIIIELANLEKRVENYKKQNQMADIGVQANLLLQTMTDYQKRRLTLETQLNIISYIEDSMKDEKKQFEFITPNLLPPENNQSSKDNGMLPSNTGADNALQKLIQEYNTALLNRTRLLRTTNEQNPVIILVEQELDIIRKNILASIVSSKEGISISLREIYVKDVEFDKKLSSIPTQEREYVEIKRQQKIKEELYLFLLQKQEETALALASVAPSAKTVDVATATGVPVSPKRSIILLLGLVIGLIIPVMVIYLLDFFNNRLSGKSEVIKAIKAPFLGSIAQADTSIVVKEGEVNPIVEMFKLIRANLRFMIKSKESPVILVTSSISGEGKSFVAVNLAMSLALMKKKTVLIGLDIRRPRLGEYLQLPKNNKGATLYLHDETTTLDDITLSVSLSPFLNVIPAGPMPPNPSELLISSRVDQLFKELKEKYDYVIIDSAPIAIISDTYLLNRVVDNTLYVLRENYTPKSLLPFIEDAYQNQKLNNIAVVLNDSKESLSPYGYGKYFKQRK